MAADWIKVEKATPDKPEIKTAAKICKVSNGEIFRAWFLLWSWFDEHVGEDGLYQATTLKECSARVGIPGIAESFAESGWLFETESGVFIKDWTRHNGQSAKIRALDLKRKKAKR